VADLPGDLALYAVSVPRIRSGVGLSRSFALRLPDLRLTSVGHCLAAPPLLSDIAIFMISTINRIHVEGTYTL
jgi:hypothetical protein